MMKIGKAGLLLVVTLVPALAGAQPVTVERRGRTQVYRSETPIEVVGRVPQDFAVTARSGAGYTAPEPAPRFVQEIPSSVRRAPF